MSYLQCTECLHIELENEIPIEGKFDSDAREYIRYLVCGECHSKEGGFEAVYECENCEELAPLVDGTDLCTGCERKAASLDRDLVKLENEQALVVDMFGRGYALCHKCGFTCALSVRNPHYAWCEERGK